MSKREVSRTGGSSVNYLDDRLLTAYFEAREHEAYFRSLKHANTRRDFHGLIIPVLIDLAGEILSSPDTKALDAILDVSAATRVGSASMATSVAEAKALHPAGFDALGVGDPLDFESLKSSYRRAARRCHPDAGGSHDAMVLVNEAYALFHALLYRRRATEAATGGGDEGAWLGSDAPVRSARDYLGSVGELLFSIKLDEWSLDDAQYWFKEITSADWAPTTKTRDPQTRVDLLGPCSTLAGRLWAAGMRDRAMEVYRFAEALLAIARTKGMYEGGGLWNADPYIKDGQKLRIILNHRRQADNALRLGLIDAKRHGQILARVGGKSADEQGRGDSLRTFVAEVGFLQDLPTDRAAKGKVAQAGLVPEPDHLDERLEDLADDQQAEYLRAFGAGAEPGLVRKYISVRLTSLLRSLILHDDGPDPSAVERECRALEQFRGKSGDGASGRVADAARFLGGLGTDQLRARLDLLRQMDAKASDGSVQTITINLVSMTSESAYSDSRFRVRPVWRYLETVQVPLDRLRLAMATGSTKSKREEAEERKVWNRDVGLANKLHERGDYKTLWAACDRGKEDPEGVVKLAAPYIEKLLGIGEKMELVEHLHVGIWYDNLTIALVRLKRWSEAQAHLERFYDLPERYRRGSNESDLESMRKRLERCRKMAGPSS